MSLIQKQKTQIELIIRKKTNGLEITIISENLKKLMGSVNWSRIREENGALYNAVFYNEFNRTNTIFNQNDIPNLTVLRNFDEINHITINNVFTNRELRKYIKLIQKKIMEISEIANIE